MLSISNEILGEEGSMSEVGIPSPHNTDKPHAPVAGNYHTIPVNPISIIAQTLKKCLGNLMKDIRNLI